MWRHPEWLLRKGSLFPRTLVEWCRKLPKVAEVLLPRPSNAVWATPATIGHLIQHQLIKQHHQQHQKLSTNYYIKIKEKSIWLVYTECDEIIHWSYSFCIMSFVVDPFLFFTSCGTLQIRTKWNEIEESSLFCDIWAGKKISFASVFLC